MNESWTGKRALIVDDASITRTMLNRFLTEDGFACQEAATEEEAIRIFHTERPDLVTLDIHMDKLSGMGVLQVLLRIDPAVRVVIVSSETDKHIVAEVLRLGAKSFVPKPFAREELTGAISRAFA